MDLRTYRTLFESIPEGIILLDENDVIKHINRNAARILGQGVQGLKGSSLRTILPSLNERPLQQAFGQKDTLCTIFNQEGEVVLSVSSAPVEGISPYNRVLVLRDVTSTQSTQQIQTYFLANITHEFRTPLSALKASVELILESLGEVSQSEIERLLRSIHYSVAGLQTLIDNLLESASIESGHFCIHPREAKLSEVVGEAVRVMAPLLHRREQGLQIEMDWSLPPLSLDPTRITQVIVNLLSNASKYSPTGKGIRIKVTPSTGNLLLISVVDQGTGLSSRDQENLFKKFVRLNDNTGEQFGVGLGLSVVKTIVEAHGGTVGVDENPAGGSIFWFTLPTQGKGGW
jgi:two-component system phosphate regulon sensor histidine kinase PhoR